MDPLTKEYPELTSYQYASNSPIENIDLDGLEKYSIHYKVINGNDIIIKIVTNNSLKYLASPIIASIPTWKPKVVQYIQEDGKGKVLKTTAEIPLKNFGSTIYAGSWNPKYGKENGVLNGTDRYDYPAVNSLDAAAKKHDLAYNLVRAEGFSGAVGDLETIAADRQLVKDATKVSIMYFLGIKDPITHKLISNETNSAAVKVVALFATIVAEKEVRIGTINVAEKTQSLWSKFKSYMNENIKEVERKLTQTSH